MITTTTNDKDTRKQNTKGDQEDCQSDLRSDEKRTRTVIANVNLAYCFLILILGMCVGYYMMPYIAGDVSDKEVFDRGLVTGAAYYRNYLERMGTFEVVSDSSVQIAIPHDTFLIYK